MTVVAPISADVLTLVGSGDLRSVYQPIVDLDTNETVGFEALARGPHNHPLGRPDVLFGAAREQGCIGELDEACRRSAMDGARAGGLCAPWTLFVNVEPAGVDWTLMRDGEPLQRRRQGVRDLPVIVEITERDLTANPTALLRFVERARAWGCGIAVDDVGAERASLALLPLLRPDVIKLDLRLVQQRPTGDVAEIVSAVNAEAERSGAVVLAEGIETQEHFDFARGLGARLGQGWLLGRPGPLPELSGVRAPARNLPIASHTATILSTTPFAVAAARIAPRTAAKPLLIEISKHLEREALRLGGNAVVVSALQHARFFTPATARRYQKLADHVAFVAILGEDLPAQPLPGLRGGHLPATDPLVGEWNIAVIGPHFAAALVARDLGDSGPDDKRRFDYILTHDRDVAVAVAATLISRVAARDPSPSIS